MKIKLNKKPFFIALGWFILTLLTFDACIGSYEELEPKAGNILLVATILFVVIGVFFYFKSKPSFLLIEEK